MEFSAYLKCKAADAKDPQFIIIIALAVTGTDVPHIK